MIGEAGELQLLAILLDALDAPEEGVAPVGDQLGLRQKRLGPAMLSVAMSVGAEHERRRPLALGAERRAVQRGADEPAHRFVGMQDLRALQEAVSGSEAPVGAG